MKSNQNDKNRDIQRQNKASTVINASLHLLVAQELIDEHVNLTSDILEEDNKLSAGTKRKLQYATKLGTTTKEVVENAAKKYCKSSSYVKGTAMILAKREHRTLKKAIKFDEFDNIQKRMPHYNERLLSYQMVVSESPSRSNIPYHRSTQSVTPCHPTQPLTTPQYRNLPNTMPTGLPFASRMPTPVPIPNAMPTGLPFANTMPTPVPIPNATPTGLPFASRMPTPVPIPNTTPNQVPIPRTDSTFPYFKIPPPTTKYYSPLQLCTFISNHANQQHHYILDLEPHKCGAYKVRSLSVNLIINLMIKLLYVPVKTTKIFRLMQSFRSEPESLIGMEWGDQSDPGRNAYLSEDQIILLREDYYRRTAGGATVSKKVLAHELNILIIDTYQKKHKEKLPNEIIPYSTLRRYVDMVVGVPEFNMMKKVSNKTESRHSAEWSVRSTISYLMVVLCTHYINAEPTKYHKPFSELMKDPTYKLIYELNREVLGIDEFTESSYHLTHALPDLVTTTDEVTLFVSSEVIEGKDSFHFSVRPSLTNQPNKDSSKRDPYTTALTGDKHHRGLRISLNNTFTAGGLSAPVFACVYGCTPQEMPGDEIVVLEVKGLVAAANMNASQSKGYVVFIRGKYQTQKELDEIEASKQLPVSGTEDNKNVPLSKESRVAKLYRDLVYYPLIRHIRTAYYGHDEKNDVPDNLTAVGWMDGCHGQLRLTTRELVLEYEKLKKIITNKQSAARTVVEQAADIGKMFFLVKRMISLMPGGKQCNSPLYCLLNDLLDLLEDPEDKTSNQIVKLSTHKKKALLAGLSKLPKAMSLAFRSDVIVKAFQDNGQLDLVDEVIPAIEGMVGTYRGVINEEHYLFNTESIIRKFYKEMYLTGRIEESSFNNENVELDRDSKNNVVNRDFGIQKENCQRAKILSAPTQIQLRKQLVQTISEDRAKKHGILYDRETKKRDLNTQCEERIRECYFTALEIDLLPRASFKHITQYLTTFHFGRNKQKGYSKFKPNRDQLIAFIQLRHPIVKFTGQRPNYLSLKNKSRDELVDIGYQSRHLPVLQRHFIEPATAT
jgi:hypothetical protein